MRKGTTSTSLSYTGCWTCRTRKVKCDEHSPSCYTCRDSGLACAGYGVRLVWDADDEAAKQRPRGRRRWIRPEENVLALMTDSELAQTLLHVDQAASARNATAVGPFSVFEVENPPRHWVGTSPRLPTAGAESPGRVEPRDGHSQALHGTSPSFDVEAASQLDASPSSHRSGSTGLEDEVDWASATVSALEGSDTQFFLSEFAGGSDNSALDNLSESSMTDASASTAESDDSEITILPTRRTPQPELLFSTSLLGRSPLSTARHSAGMHDWSPTATMLMQHYAKSMVHLMQPIFHEASPFERIYLPLAIAGSANILGDQSTSPSTAVCHSLLSAAASNLRSLGSGVQGLQTLAWQHKQKALTALRSALASRSSTYRELMVAILSLVSADLLNGGVDDHWIHLEAARQLQASRHFATVVSHETRQLDSICKMLRLFAQTTLRNPEPEPWPGSGMTFREADFDSLSPSIEYIYGIARPTAGAILKTYRLTQILAHYRRASLDFPETVLQACEDLGDELASWSVSSEAFSAVGCQDQQMLSIVRAQATAFDAAAKIYYSRSVQSCRREDLVEEQSTALAALNEAEDVKAALGGTVSLPAPITWPAFVASCEAVGDVRDSWIEWWQRIQSYQMKNYAQQFGVVQKVWAKLDELQHPATDWREALVALHVRILPV